MTYRVIHWATGGLGIKAVAGIVGHPELELVGTWVHSEEKQGRDVAELCGLDQPTGVLATGDKDALLALPADCICFTAGRTWTSDPMYTVDELARILRSGKNVVNATWPALVHPESLGQGIHETLQAACIEGGSTLYTSGIDPGFGSTGLAVTALTASSEVHSVRTYEILNYAGWDYPDMLDLMFGFGQSDPDKGMLFTPGVTAGIFRSTLDLIAEAMGVTIESVEEAHEVIYADEAFDITAMHIPAGTVAGARFEVKGMIDDHPTVVVEHVTRLRDEDFPHVPFEGYRAEILGEPNIKLDLELSSDKGDIAHAGYVACAMALVNAIPQVCEAPPGVLTFLDLLPHPNKNVRPGGR